jgi:hypothetical protein
VSTFDEFCNRWNVTGHERKKLILYLAFLRMIRTLKMDYPGIE